MGEVALGDTALVAGHGREEAQRLGERVHVLQLDLGLSGLLMPHLLLEQGVHDDGSDSGVGKGLDPVDLLLDGAGRGHQW